MLCPFQTMITHDRTHVSGGHYRDETFTNFAECKKEKCPAYHKEIRIIPNTGGCEKTVEKCLQIKR